MDEPTKANSIEKKWGKDALSIGWTPVPVALMFLQNHLRISPTEMNVLLNLLVHWWRAGEVVYPAQDAIAHRMGVSKRTIQRSMDRLEELGLIERTSTSRSSKYKGRNLYDLEPLRKTLETYTPGIKEDMEYWKEVKKSKGGEI